MNHFLQMKNIYAVFWILLLIFISSNQTHAQRNHTGGRFALDIAGYNKGYLKPFMRGDTLFYTVKSVNDTLLVRKKCDSLFQIYGRRYNVQYKIKNR